MGFTIIKWLVGLAVIAGGSAYIYSRTTGKKIFAKDACVADLPEDQKLKVDQAIAASNIAALNAYADAAEEDGFDCAADEIRAKAIEVQDALDKKASKCPTKAELDLALADMVSKKLTKEKAVALALNLRKGGCNADAEIIEQKIIDVYPTAKEDLENVKKAESNSAALPSDKVGKFIAAALNKVSAPSSNEVRASVDWPNIMNPSDPLPEDIKGTAQSFALGLKKTSTVYLLASEGSDGYSSMAVVNLQPAISGYMPDPNKIDKVINRLHEFGTTYGKTIGEFVLMKNSIAVGKFTNE